MRSGRSRFFKLFGGTVRNSMTIEAWMGTPGFRFCGERRRPLFVDVLWLESWGGNLRGRDQSIRVD